MIPIAAPLVSEDAIRMVSNTLRTRWIGQGPRVDQFEDEFARKFNLPEGSCVAVNSGTAALELAYELLGLGPGDEVITTPLTCTATNIPLVRRGCRLVFADIRRDTLNIDLEDIERKITIDTKAVVNVHLHGVESDVGNIPKPLPPKNGYKCFEPAQLVNDSAQALGLFGGRFTCCSFQAIKHITTGDGGMLVCYDPEDAVKARLLRWFGIDRAKKLSNDWQPYRERKILFDIDYPGHKYQMNDIAASLGIAGLREYDAVMELRGRIWDIYRQAGLPLVDGPRNVYGYACLLIEDRDRFASRCKEGGVETNVMQVRNDLYQIFAPFRTPLPNMDWVHERHICIPMHNAMTLDDARHVASVAKGALA